MRAANLSCPKTRLTGFAPRGCDRPARVVRRIEMRDREKGILKPRENERTKAGQCTRCLKCTDFCAGSKICTDFELSLTWRSFTRQRLACPASSFTPELSFLAMTDFSLGPRNERFAAIATQPQQGLMLCLTRSILLALKVYGRL